MTVLIAGAGIGGLTLGLTLNALGLPFRIHEAVADLRPLGVGINVQPHAVRELHDLGLAADLDSIGLRIEGVAYFSAQGRAIWREARGIAAGYRWPQVSVHRGLLQDMLRRVLIARAGPAVLRTGSAIVAWSEEAGGVTVALADRKSGRALGTDRGAVLVAADGINSTIRARLYPGEGPAKWRGVMMWRGITDGAPVLGGRTMAMIGTRARKFVVYPIADLPDGRQRLNWIADLAFPPGHDWQRQDWTRQGRLEDFAPQFAGWRFGWIDVPGLIAAAAGVWEYPMVDRDPLPAWTHGAVTLLGDAAHPMYPIGSNGASQAILDARHLGRCLRDHGIGPAALAAYDAARREAVNAIVLANRGDGPDAILDRVAERAPDGFDDIEAVMPLDERRAMADDYKRVAGMDVAALNARPPILAATA
jgi:2-polyprenyl-6-methoxyphenol hydroxylase-like FAD-dependent oxidoreductase